MTMSKAIRERCEVEDDMMRNKENRVRTYRQASGWLGAIDNLVGRCYDVIGRRELEWSIHASLVAIAA